MLRSCLGAQLAQPSMPSDCAIEANTPAKGVHSGGPADPKISTALAQSVYDAFRGG